MLPAPAILGCERWFVRRGVPHFIEHYDASEHIWTRSLPLLVVIYVLRGLYALDLGKGVVFNLIALLLTLVVLVATWAIANLAGNRPAFAWPREVLSSRAPGPRHPRGPALVDPRGPVASFHRRDGRSDAWSWR